MQDMLHKLTCQVPLLIQLLVRSTYFSGLHVLISPCNVLGVVVLIYCLSLFLMLGYLVHIMLYFAKLILSQFPNLLEHSLINPGQKEETKRRQWHWKKWNVGYSALFQVERSWLVARGENAMKLNPDGSLAWLKADWWLRDILKKIELINSIDSLRWLRWHSFIF